MRGVDNMRIQVQTEGHRLFSIQPDSKLTLIIYNILIDKLHCQITELVSKPSVSMGLIKAKLPLNKSLNDVVDTLQGYFGGYISQEGDNFLITDKEDEVHIG
jgi:hypothetical protein